MEHRRHIIIVIILSLLVISLSGTFAYFTSIVSSKPNAVNVESADLKLNLNIVPKYAPGSLIPMNNSDAITGYQNECKDINNYNVCYAYTITLTNTGTEKQSLKGWIRTSMTNVENLSYLVLDKDNNIYQSTTAFQNLTETSLTAQSLGNEILLTPNQSTTLTLLIWLTNLSTAQEGQDANGSFRSLITYNAVRGDNGDGSISAEITGTMN